MKTHDVKLEILDEKLDQRYTFEELTDEQIVERRWKKTERALKKTYPYVIRAYRMVGDDVLDTLKTIGFTYDRLNQKVNSKVKRYVQDQIESWHDLGLVTGYLQYLISTHTWTYKSVLKLLICGIYAKRLKKVKTVSNDVFKVSAVDAYNQSIADRREDKFPLLTLAVILSFCTMPVTQNTYLEYLDGVLMSQVDQMEVFVLMSLQSVEIDENALKITLIKQAHRILKVNDDKFSGALDDATRNVSNQAYTWGPKNQKVRFVAVIDEKTTRMCKSLNGQIFNTIDENTFTRYSDLNKADITVTCKGLVQGLNMPPISDHFHWCRSTLTYQI